MDKTYNHMVYEEKIYSLWERSGSFTPKIDPKKKPFTIILPLPNANDPMHMGHALFTIEDIMVRYHRMLGNPTLWLPGGDHAGIETQYVFEKHLKEQGKSRFDYDRETLYKMIWEFAESNRDLNKNQMRQLGFSMDWSRYHYSLETQIVKQVLATFVKLHKDNLAYRGERIVNYCTRCGTAYSELEVNYKERDDLLYYLDYGKIQIATTRPETIFADVAVAVNPTDSSKKKLIGKFAIVPLINIQVPIISDDNIDIKFGTGALKVTPAHDPLDYEIGRKNGLETINIIEKNGTLTNCPRVPKKLQGLYVNEARKTTVDLLRKNNKLIKTEELKHSVGTCYRCGNTIEPLLMPQWFIKTKPLAEKAIRAVRTGKTKIVPKKRFEKLYFDWMENIRDWNISRQVVWGPRIPVWYCLPCNPNIHLTFIDKGGNNKDGLWKNISESYTFNEIYRGLQTLSAPIDAKHQLEKGCCKYCKGNLVLQETDTFDTWFLSGQWPLTTLGFNVENPKQSSSDFKYFYPTSVLDTLWDILFFWVGRMMMFGLYLTDEVPFKTIHLHARVVDKLGRKMSKSKGNVINPIEMVNKYGADALRMSLVMSIAPASDICLTDEKVMSMRNFSNKVWNISRFIIMNINDFGVKSYEDLPPFSGSLKGLSSDDIEIVSKLNNIIKNVTSGIENYKFGIASEILYDFIWHDLADKYIEKTKDRLFKKDNTPLVVLRYVLIVVLKLLHPFMPFVTEAIWQEIKNQRKNPNQLLIEAPWPKAVEI